MRRSAIVVLVLFSLPQLAAAQAGAVRRQAPAGGSIEGAVFYLTQSGDLKKGAGLQVRLLAHPDTVFQLLDRNCTDFVARFAPIKEAMTSLSVSGYSERPFRRADSLFAETMLRTDSIISAHTLASVSSGMNAHYAFNDIPAGDYLLHTNWSVVISQSERVYQWLVPVAVNRGAHQTVDLDTISETSRRIYCGIK